MPGRFVEDQAPTETAVVPEPRTADRQGPRIDLSVPRILGGALAAASAAIASSWLGVAGTVLGAVVVSVVATVGTAVYAHSLERSRLVLREVPVRAAQSRLVASHARQDKHPMPDIPAQRAGSTTSHVRAVVEPVMSTPPARRIRWGAVAVSAVVTLVVGFGLLTAFELAVGRSAESLTGSGGGGTTVGRLLGVQHDSDQQGPSKQQPSKQSQQPTQTAPTSPATTVPTTPTATEPTQPTETSPTEPTPPTSPTPPTTPPTGGDTGAGGAHAGD